MSRKQGWQPSPTFPGALTYVPAALASPQNIPQQASAPYSYDTVTTVGPSVVRTPVCYNQAYSGSGGDQVFVSDVGGDYIFLHYSLSYAVAGPLITSLVYCRLGVYRGGNAIWAVDILLKPGGSGGQSMDNIEGNPGFVLQKGDSIHVYVGQADSTTYQAIASVTLQPYK